MNCLKGHIGIKGTGAAAPESGIYINQLPGISLQNIQRTANSEQVTYAEVWSDVQDRAGRRIVTDLRNKLRSRYKIKTNNGFFFLETMDQGTIIAAAAHYRGLVYDAGIDQNGFFSFHVTSVTVDLPQALDTLTVLIMDRVGNILDTLVKENASEGLNTITVNQAYAASSIFIAIDSTAVPLKETNLNNVLTDGYYALLSSLLGAGCTPALYGATAGLSIPAIRSQSTSTYGISAVIMPTCDYSALICWNKELFESAWIYLCGAELMLERTFSDRINKLTTVDKDQAEALRDLYTGQYEQALEDTIGGLTINAEDGCIECQAMVKTVERLP
jgi:hypothetical protein